MTERELYRLQEAVQTEKLAGWLFHNFHHRDIISDSILRIDPRAANSRSWIYAVPARGQARKIVHAIEAGILARLPGITSAYLNREEFTALLIDLARGSSGPWGVHADDALSAVSFLDAGTASLLKNAGFALTSAAALIQRFKGLLDASGIESHQRTAEILYDLVAEAWNMVKTAGSAGKILYEGQIRQFFLDECGRRGLTADHPPIVAFGVHSGNPHYDFSGSGADLQEGDTVQFDIWAKENREDAIYADISWIGVNGPQPSQRLEQAFADLIAVREETLRYLETAFAARRPVSGAEVDAFARSGLTARGYAEALRHRTGHGIDTECHGSGVNMDSVEFPDSRVILEGSCFSLEPGIYFPDFGLRTEINVYIAQGKPRVSGKTRQFNLLTLP
ncbi:MAG: aminopeptidase P family protein [Spirochaetaceae bacterium]|jgi:Xaa-Pro aminopeptidase|nr:aminopeptidase P family protein [Spirochaetaceae bacterium]